MRSTIFQSAKTFLTDVDSPIEIPGYISSIISTQRLPKMYLEISVGNKRVILESGNLEKADHRESYEEMLLNLKEGCQEALDLLEKYKEEHGLS